VIDRQLATRLPSYKSYVFTNVVISFFLDVMLIIAGIGLLMMANWARYLSIAYAIFSLFTKLLLGLYLLVFLVGAVSTITDEEFQKNPKLAAAGTPGTMKVSRLIRDFAWLIPGIYPVIVLALLLRPSTARAFAAAARTARRDEDEDYPRRRPPPDDDYDDRPWRSRREDDDRYG
jgi:hypothetical protein